MFGWKNRQTHVLRPGVMGAGVYLAYIYAPALSPLKILQLVTITTGAVAAHATEIAPVVLTDRGAAGAGSTVVATNTNDSDVTTAAATRTKSGAYAAKTPFVNNFEDNPYELAAGNVLEVSFDPATADPEMTINIVTAEGD